MKQVEEKRENAYKKQLEEQKKINDNAADDNWKQEYLRSISKNLRKKGVE